MTPRKYVVNVESDCLAVEGIVVEHVARCLDDLSDSGATLSQAAVIEIGDGEPQVVAEWVVETSDRQR